MNLTIFEIQYVLALGVIFLGNFDLETCSLYWMTMKNILEEISCINYFKILMLKVPISILVQLLLKFYYILSSVQIGEWVVKLVVILTK
jgi:hypothetical protein